MGIFRKSAESDGVGADQPAPEQAATKMAQSKGRVLVVDDEEPIRDIVSRVLDAEGYDCTVAGGGKEALEIASKQKFDVVLLDIMMPEVSGIDVLRHLATDCPDACVVMTTAVDDMPTAAEALNLGATDYVTKPFNLADLSGRVEEALEASKRLQGKTDL
jgi:two-component system OmpR family response regulator